MDPRQPVDPRGPADPHPRPEPLRAAPSETRDATSGPSGVSEPAPGTGARDAVGIAAASAPQTPSTANSPRSSTDPKIAARAKPKPPPIGFIGVTLIVVLTPVMVIAFGMVLLSVIGALTGWSPPALRQSTSVDPLYNGEGFTKPRAIMIAVGLAVGYVAAALMRWGIHRRPRRARSQPMARRTA